MLFTNLMESLSSTEDISLLSRCSEEEARLVGVALIRITVGPTRTLVEQTNDD